jgi:hypothetical protein
MVGAYWFHDITASFYLALFLPQWWIGWQIDVRSKVRDHPRMAVILGNSPGLPLSLVCLYASGHLFSRLLTLYYAGGFTLPVSMLIWGIVLLFYFVKNALTGETAACYVIF